MILLLNNTFVDKNGHFKNVLQVFMITNNNTNPKKENVNV